MNDQKVKMPPIPKNIDQLLTPISLAYWIMDDGYIHSRDKTISLCTDSYTLSEVEGKRTTLVDLR